MHEFSLAAEMAAQIKQQIGGNKLLQVVIEAGVLSGVVPDSLQFAAETIFLEHFGPGVKVVIDTREAEADCQCGRKIFYNDAFEPCPFCGEFQRVICAGTEVLIKEIEIED